MCKPVASTASTSRAMQSTPRNRAELDGRSGFGVVHHCADITSAYDKCQLILQDNIIAFESFGRVAVFSDSSEILTSSPYCSIVWLTHCCAACVHSPSSPGCPQRDTHTPRCTTVLL